MTASPVSSSLPRPRRRRAAGRPEHDRCLAADLPRLNRRGSPGPPVVVPGASDGRETSAAPARHRRRQHLERCRARARRAGALPRAPTSTPSPSSPAAAREAESRGRRLSSLRDRERPTGLPTLHLREHRRRDAAEVPRGRVVRSSMPFAQTRMRGPMSSAWACRRSHRRVRYHICLYLPSS